MRRRRIKVRGIRRQEIDTDQLALVYWLLAKRAVEEKRQREADEKKQRIEKVTTVASGERPHE
jgi:hypothetical protein